MMNLKKKTVTALLSLLCLVSYAQTKNAVWIEYYPDLKMGNWRLTPEVSYRSTDVDFIGQHTFYFRPTATYTVNKYLSVAGALAYYVSWEDHTANKHEWSIYQNVSAKTPSWGGFHLALNARIEEIFMKEAGDADHAFGLRLRWTPKLSYALPFWERRKMSVSLFTETYNYLTASRSGRFNNSLDLGAGFSISPWDKLDVTLEYRRKRNYVPGKDPNTNLIRLMVRHRIL